jgi:release factor glutamine methyltransferase
MEARRTVPAPPVELNPDLRAIDRHLRLRLARHSDTPGLDSQVLLAHILGRRKSWLAAHPDYRPNLKEIASLEIALRRLESGEPLPYLLGWWEFYGLKIDVSPAVLIPRPETELLVVAALDWLESRPVRWFAADVGTGSGCIAVALARSVPRLRLVATDLSYASLEVARQNIEKHGLSAQVFPVQADLLAPARRKYDLICANLPYIPAEMLSSLAVSANEPALALDGGPGGLALITRLLAQAAVRLESGGLLLLEIEASQGRMVVEAAAEAFPRATVRLAKDLAGHDRILSVELPG